jgi:hypothetical protein
MFRGKFKCLLTLVTQRKCKIKFLRTIFRGISSFGKIVPILLISFKVITQYFSEDRDSRLPRNVGTNTITLHSLMSCKTRICIPSAIRTLNLTKVSIRVIHLTLDTSPRKEVLCLLFLPSMAYHCQYQRHFVYNRLSSILN